MINEIIKNKQVKKNPNQIIEVNVNQNKTTKQYSITLPKNKIKNLKKKKPSSIKLEIKEIKWLD